MKLFFKLLLTLLPFIGLSQSDDTSLTTQNNTTIYGQTFSPLRTGNMFNGIVLSKVNVQRDNSVTASGTNTYTATVSPPISSYVLGFPIRVLFTNANAGASTINLNGLGARDITINGSTPLVTGDIPAGSWKYLVYDGTRFQIIGGGGSGGITTLNTLTGTTQTFATGAAGTDFGISSATTTHTFNLPSSSAANRGLLTAADWTAFNAKQAGDADLTTIAGLTPSNDDFMQYKAGAWANRNITQVKTDLNLAGTNSGDQTSIVGITGTTAQFNTALTDGDFATGGGTATGTNTGDQTITLTGDISGSGTGSFATTYNGVVPANKGGAGSLNGILKANGSGTVSAAVAGTDYVATESDPLAWKLSTGGTLTGANTITTTTANTLAFALNDASTNTVLPIFSTTRNTSATAVSGIGSSWRSGVEQADGSTLYSEFRNRYQEVDATPISEWHFDFYNNSGTITTSGVKVGNNGITIQNLANPAIEFIDNSAGDVARIRNVAGARFEYNTGTFHRFQISSNEIARINSVGFGVGDVIPTTARLHVKGAGTTTGTAIRVDNSSSSPLLEILDNNTVLFGGSAGTSGQFLKSNGTGSAPTWETLAGGGDMLSTNNLSDVANVTTARNNILPTKTGNSLKVLRVNAGETDYELATLSGSIGGSTGSVDNSVLRADGTGGATLQSSGLNIDDDGNLTVGSNADALHIITAGGSVGNVGLVLRGKGTGNGLTIQNNSTPNSQMILGSSTITAYTPTNTTFQQLAGSFYIESVNTPTNTPITSLHLSARSSNTPAIGIANRIVMETETSASNYEEGALIEATTTDVTGGSEDFDLVFKTMAAGAIAAERLRLSSTGALGVNGTNYGTNGQVLTSSGSASAPTWTTPSGIGGSTGSTDNAILRADGTGGSTLQSSGPSINDNGEIVTTAGTTTSAALSITSGTLVTTPDDGDLEMDADAMYITTDAGNRGVVAGEHWRILGSSLALSNSVSEQAMFDSPTSLTLEAGTYRFEAQLYITGMSATSGNAAFDILGAGSSTISEALYSVWGIDNNSPLNVGTRTGGMNNAAQSGTSMVSGGTGTGMTATIRGIFRISAGGSITPSITLLTASAATMVENSYFMCNRIGSSTVTVVGDWN